MKEISIIGHGRVGGSLASALRSAGFDVKRIVVRDGSPLDPVSREDGISLIRWSDWPKLDSDLVIIATGDSNISEADLSLSKIDGIGNASVLHTSGLHSSAMLERTHEAGASVGSMHPLASFPDSAGGTNRFLGVSFCLEGDPKAVKAAEELVAGLGGESFTVESDYKALYHASAVMACGNLVALISESVRMMSLCGVDEQESLRRLEPLIRGTIENIFRLGITSSLTGPFARLDESAVDLDIRAVESVGDENLNDLFKLLGEVSIKLSVSSEEGAGKAKRIIQKM
jgi:predicted short-subunit dehydrogenase-like oxidoreductase (DUF2520 family)